MGSGQDPVHVVCLGDAGRDLRGQVSQLSMNSMFIVAVLQKSLTPNKALLQPLLTLVLGPVKRQQYFQRWSQNGRFSYRAQPVTPVLLGFDRTGVGVLAELGCDIPLLPKYSHCICMATGVVVKELVLSHSPLPIAVPGPFGCLPRKIRHC